MLTDCHTHLDSFTDDEVGEVLGRARDAGVGMVITAGTTLASSERAVELTALYPGLFAGVGVHPMDLTGEIDTETRTRLFDLAASTDKVVVVSEIGLDFMEGMPDRADQYQAFRAQIGMARELRLPIVFHSREAHDATLRVLREERAYEVGGAMHYFQTDRDTAQQALDLGFYISLARPLLRLPELQAVAASLPLEGIVAGDGRRAPAVQGQTQHVDRAAARPGRGREAGRAARDDAGTRGGGDHGQPARDARRTPCRRGALPRRRLGGPRRGGRGRNVDQCQRVHG